MFHVFVFKMKSNVTLQLNQPIVCFYSKHQLNMVNRPIMGITSYRFLYVLPPLWNPNAGLYCIGFCHLVTWSAWIVVVILVYQDILSNAIRIIAGDELRHEIDGSCVLVEASK